MKKILFVCTLFAFTATILPRASDASPTVKELSYKAPVAEKMFVVVDHAMQPAQLAPLVVGDMPAAFAEIVHSPTYNFRAGKLRGREVDRYHISFDALRMVKGIKPIQRE